MTLYILDGTAMLHRCYYSKYREERLVNRGGQFIDTGALIEFSERVAHFLVTVRPKYVAMCFDEPRTTWRHIIYPQYKQNRPPKPKELESQLEMAPRVARALGLKTFSHGGFEADDVMATLAAWARGAPRLSAVVASNDKDLLQLVGDRVFAMDPSTLRLSGAEEVRARLGVGPAQVVDLLALQGDSADNV
eukprot:CAMPEP_0194663484 /NCGR_PEP_ID=MMETSP0295-20121207/854_1 /TAXON_ID=39354 /ORGANISM="Heterosigma akashiwo, Strain CCMP2393" /LENGTH=190 /DNA_ID=CAMNT_0039544965 /DNA_START=249 /DNA_END=818 /DNA_ORIENTATION=+